MRATRDWKIEATKHQQILELLRSGVGIRTTARRVGVGVMTVQRRAEVLRQEGLEEGETDYRRVMSRRCPVHGKLAVWPCVACAAIEYANQNSPSLN